MSYILDALRKAEQERKLGQPPTIMSIADQEEGGKKHRFAFLFLIIVLVNVGVLFVFWPGPLVEQVLAPAKTDTSSPVEQPPDDAMTAQIVISESPTPYPEQARKPPAKPLVSAKITEPVSAESAALDFSQRVTLADDLLAPEQPPLLHALPPQVRDSLPLLNLDIHVYSELTDKRFVLINSVRYQQGDWLNEGPLLEAITEEGVILNHREQRFRLLVQR